MNRSPYWTGMLVALAILLVVALLDRHDRDMMQERARADMERELATFSANLEGIFSKYFYLGAGLSAYVANHPDVTQAEFAAVVGALAHDDPLLRQVSLARANVVSHVYPVDAARHLLGLNLLETSSFRGSVLRAMNGGSPAVSGPIGLKGGTAFLLRTPVFLPAADGGRGAYWGLVNVVLDVGAVLDKSGLSILRSRGELAIRSWDDERMLPLYGNDALFERSAVTTQIRLASGAWYVAATVTPAAIHEVSLWPRLVGILAALLGGALVMLWRRDQQAMRQMALHDCLTGLPNRLLLQDRMQQACASVRRSGKQVVLMYLDLDNFKPVNDSYGHQAGDRVLREVAQRLRACVRRTDTVARVSGDEFVVVLAGLGYPREAEAVAEKILLSFARPIVAGDHSFVLGGSVGLYLVGADCDVERALSRADSAMYAAKRDGKNTFRWYVPEPEQLDLGVALAKTA